MRHPYLENYELTENKVILHGSDITLDQVDSPTFLGIRQRDFNMNLGVDVAIDGAEAGVTVYSCENEHYDLAIRKVKASYEAVLRLNIGGIKHEQAVAELPFSAARLCVGCDGGSYYFTVIPKNADSTEAPAVFLGGAQTKYVSKEVSEGFTGVVLGLYAVGRNSAEFVNFNVTYGKDR